MVTTEEILQQRKDIEAENQKLRKYMNTCRQQIKDYEQRIQAIRFALQHTRQQIADNNDKFFELGKQLKNDTYSKL